MAQSINFLRSFPKPREYLTANLFIFSVIFLIAALIAISTVMTSYQWSAHSEQKVAEEHRRRAETAYQQLAEKYPLFNVEKPLVEQVSEFESMLRRKSEEFADITHDTMRTPFSSYLQTMAKMAPPGLWLIAFKINQDTQDISLRGYSTQPVTVSIFLQALQTTPPFNRNIFDLFYVKKVPDKPYIEFEIANNYLLGSIEEALKERASEKKATLKK
jgi:Tfp pilus assembly protein PilN